MLCSSGRSKKPVRQPKSSWSDLPVASVGLPGTTRCWTGGCHYDEQVYNGEMGEKEGQNGLCAVVRHSSEETRVVKNGLMLAACLPPETRWHLGLGSAVGHD